MSLSSNYIEINANYGIDGCISAEQMKFLTSKYKSVLYLCPDTETDKGCDGGFNGLLANFPADQVKSVILDVGYPEYSATDSKPLLAIQAYKRFENALKSLQTPTIVVCKTARRASAVIFAYLVIYMKLINTIFYVVLRL